MYKRQQKYNCSLVRLDYQQEQGLVSSLPLGVIQDKGTGTVKKLFVDDVDLSLIHIFQSGSLKADSGRITDAETANSLKEKCTGRCV